MKTRIKPCIPPSIITILRSALLGSFVVGLPLLATGQENHQHSSPAKLVQIVRDATQQFIDVNNTGRAGYGPAFGCVSGPDHGAMGIHYINGTLVGDGEIDAQHPEALIYEPVGNRRRLVGVEYIVIAATWLANHNGVPPMLEAKPSSSLTARTDTVFLQFSSCMSGLGATIPTARAWTGTTR